MLSYHFSSRCLLGRRILLLWKHASLLLVYIYMTLYLSLLSPNACKHDIEIEGMRMDFSLELLPSCFKLGQNAKAKILFKIILTAWRQKRKKAMGRPRPAWGFCHTGTLEATRDYSRQGQVAGLSPCSDLRLLAFRTYFKPCEFLQHS